MLAGCHLTRLIAICYTDFSPFWEGSLRLISLLTDFGLQDGYVGVMKGVIWKIVPEVDIVDITHAISPQNIQQGALSLGRVHSHFPDETIFIVIVDPGVGTERRCIAAQLGKQYFVGPDNGLITLMLEQCEASGGYVQVIHLTNPRYWLPEPSKVFHGRDIFSPVAAHLAMGVPLAEMGEPIADVIRLILPKPERTRKGYRGEVTSVDTFGNLETNLLREHLTSLGSRLEIRVAGQVISGMVEAFGDRPIGELVALYGTHDDLMISVVNGSAARLLGTNIGVGTEVEVYAK